MSAEGLFKGLGSGLGDVMVQQGETQREQARLDAEASMEKARILEEDNLSRFHEQSEDARANKQRDLEKQLHDIDQSAIDRRQSAELKQAQDQFEKNFGVKVGEDFEGRVLTAQDLASRQLQDYQLKIQQNPMLQMQYSQLLQDQQALASEADPQKRAAIQARIDSSPINKGMQQVQQQALASVMSVASNPTEYASLAVRYGRQSPEQAMVLARAKYGQNPSTTPSPTAPAAPKAPAPAGGLVTPDMLDQTRFNTLGPGSATAADPAATHYGLFKQPTQGNDLIPPQGP